MTNDAALPIRLVGRITSRDFDSIADLFVPEPRFRALIPSALREADSAEGVASWFREWFKDSTDLSAVDVSSEPISDRLRFAYRIEGVEDGEPYVVEQQAYCILEDGRISDMSIVCSGFRPVATDAHATHRFDAGNLGCTDGLPQEFRRRITAIPVGDTLEVVARDPSAKADLPSLARMMGHRVAAVDEQGGILTIAIKRLK